MINWKRMRKENKALLVISIFLLIFGTILAVIRVTRTEITPYVSSTQTGTEYRTIGGFFSLVGVVLLLAAIGRERARRY